MPKDNTWERITPGIIPGNTEISPYVFSAIPAPAKALEIGCGDGRIIDLLLANGYSVTGVDINAAAIEKLKEKYLGTGVKLHCDSVLNPDFKPDVFRLAFMQGVVSTLKPADRQPAFRIAARLLANGGLLHVAEFKVDESTPEKVKRYNDDLDVTGEYGTLAVRGDDGNVLFTSHNFRPDELGGLFEGAGLELVEQQEKVFTSYHGNKKPGLIYIGRKG